MKTKKFALAALFFALLSLGGSRPAQAELVNGLPAAFTVDALIGTGSLVSIIGNSIDLARKKPTKGWMYSGFILGAMNTAIGVIVTPIILIVNGPQPIEYGTENTCTQESKMLDPATMMPITTSYPCGANRLDVAVGLAVAHSAIGITNLALAIRNAVIWHRQRVAEEVGTQEPPSALSRLNVAPMVGRDLAGGPVYGVSASFANF